MQLDYTTKEIINRIIAGYLYPHRSRMWLAVACMMVVAFSGAANAYLLQPALDEIFLNENERLLWLIPLAIIGIAFIGGVANYGQTMMMRYVGQRIVADMQTQLFDHFMHADLGMFYEQASGRLVSRFTNDIQMMRQAVSSALAGLAKEFLSLAVLVALMIYQSWELSIIALVAFPLAVFPIIRLGKRMRKVADGIQRELGEFTANLDETFQNVRVVKAHGCEDYETDRAQSGIYRLFSLYMKASRVQAAASPLMEIVGAIGIAVVIGYGGHQVIHGENTPGGFFSFIAAMIMAYKPLRSLAGLNNQLQEGLAAANRFFGALDKKAQIKDAPNATTLHVPNGDIVMDNVDFYYSESIPALKHVSLTVPAGQMVALVGPSGSGKSTIMNLLLRFYDVTNGSIWIDGQDITEVTLRSLRDSIAIVTQDIMLFDDSVANNIAYGQPDVTREQVVEAAKQAAADSFIRNLPHGYDTRVGPGGITLSGGQRQRLCIARALLKDAPILLLDEATSALDTESERMVQHALHNLMESRTSLVIAHRLSTILHADHIYVLDHGRIIEHGTHDGLLEKEGAYSRLYHRQFASAASLYGDANETPSDV